MYTITKVTNFTFFPGGRVARGNLLLEFSTLPSSNRRQPIRVSSMPTCQIHS